MTMRPEWILSLVALTWLAAPVRAARASTPQTGTDNALAAARAYVANSDRYLHHDRLKRGMKGYGLTVLAGTRLVRFNAEILSVVAGMSPQQSAIMARLSGQRLEKTGIIQGMSGSPVFVRDPRDGKDKIIGAVAFGWFAQKEPVCGIQPITQMLAIRGVLPGKDKAKDGGKPPAPPGVPKSQASSSAVTPEAFLRAALNPKKTDFSASSRLWFPARRARPAGRMTPLPLPMAIAGADERTLAYLRRWLTPAGILPVQGGGPGGAAKAAAGEAKLVPGAAVSVPLVSGDMDWSAVGTVTDVIGDKVLAFGHSFFSQGPTEMPMSTAYVHTVISGMLSSFKLSSSLKQTGALQRDENVGILGRIGRKASTIPVTVTVDWKHEGRKQTYRYQICRHRLLMPALTAAVVRSSAWAWHDLPEHHTVRYGVEIDFGGLGRYRASNVASDDDVLSVVSDTARPLLFLLHNPLGPPPKVQSVQVNLTIEPEATEAAVLKLQLDGKVYRPGETVTGRLVVRQFRRKRQTLPIRFPLPKDLAEGPYQLTAGDAQTALRARISEMPQRYRARTVQELFNSIQRVVQPNGSHLYLRLPRRRGGLALAGRELPDLPESRARILAEAAKLDTHVFSSALERSMETQFVLTGSASAAFAVQDRPKETLIRK